MRIEGLCWHVWVAGRVAAAIWCRGCRRTLGCARSDSPDGGDNRNCSSSDTTTTHPLALQLKAKHVHGQHGPGTLRGLRASPSGG